MWRDNYQLYKGDCFEILPTLQAESIDMVLCDPPYLKNYSTGFKIGVKRKAQRILNDTVGTFDFEKLIMEYSRVLKPDGHLYIFGCWQTGEIFKEAIEKHFNLKNKLIWVKERQTGGNLEYTYGQSYEEIWFATKGNYKKLNGHRDRDCLFYKRVPAQKNQFHPNQKPIDLLEFLIEKSTCEGDTVLDACMGSGSTGIAALRMGRKFIGIELDEYYYDIANQRFEDSEPVDPNNF